MTGSPAVHPDPTPREVERLEREACALALFGVDIRPLVADLNRVRERRQR
jgi:hypothetical protein